MDTANVQSFIDASMIASMIGFFVPLVVSIVTKRDASDGVKAAAAAVGAIVAAVLGLWLKADHGPITWQLVVYTLLTAIVTQISAYKALWQHGATQALANATQNFGVGKVIQGEVIR